MVAELLGLVAELCQGCAVMSLVCILGVQGLIGASAGIDVCFGVDIFKDLHRVGIEKKITDLVQSPFITYM